MNIKPGIMGPIRIVDFDPRHQPYFELFNRKWIEENYDMEPIDIYVLTNPEEAILKPGGAILMALYGDEVAGTVALRKIDEQTYEFTKMAVDEKYRRKGIARALSLASFKKARSLGATSIILYSNKLQQAAINLYENLGFEHAVVEPGKYKRANVKMILSLDAVASTYNSLTHT